MRIATLAPVVLLALAACSGDARAPNATEETVAPPGEARNAAGSEGPTGNDAVATLEPDRSRIERDAALAAGEVGKCDFEAWSSDKDPAGLNARAGPSPTAAVIGTVPAPVNDGERDWASGFTVAEARNGWFRIHRVQIYVPNSKGAAWRTIPVAGWIHGRYLGFALQTELAFAAPNLAARVVASEADDGGRYTDIGFKDATDCKGKWVKLSVWDKDPRPRPGWVSGICPVQETTCDGGTYGVMRSERRH